MLTSFGEEISQTPLQLAALMGAIANGGTLYYLQYPRSPAEAQQFVPKVKRELDIKRLIPEVKPGMLGAVEYGTARRIVRARIGPIAGKTGTCTEQPHAPGVVRIVQRRRTAKAGGGGSADRRAAGDRAAGGQASPAMYTRTSAR